MKVRVLVLCLTPFLAALPAAAHADQASATTCSGSLSKDAKILYDKTAPTMAPNTDIKEALTAVARPLVMDGSMSRASARAAAEQAAECLKLLK